MYRLSRRIIDWYQLAALMNMEGAEREEIRRDCISYIGDRSRAEKILATFNNGEGFSREKLAQYLMEIKQSELIKPVITGEWRAVT